MGPGPNRAHEITLWCGLVLSKKLSRLPNMLSYCVGTKEDLNL